MPLKKSALLLIILSVSSISLLVFASAITPPVTDVPVLPVKCVRTNSCNQMNENKLFQRWDMFSQIVLRSAA
ncbi:MAG: hypothetical protein ABIN01_19500 [Ferruginibacter sp.]